MKTIIKSFVLGFITLIGCSCEQEDYTNGNRSVIQVDQNVNYEVPKERVVKSMIGDYYGEKGEVVIIKEDYISIKTDHYDEYIVVSDMVAEGALRCYLLITLPDGRKVKLNLGWYADNPSVRNILFVDFNTHNETRLEKVTEQ